MASVELRPMGDRAVLACGMADPAAWSQAVKKKSDPFLTDGHLSVIPAADTVLVVCSSPRELAAIEPVLAAIDPAITLTPSVGATVEIPVVYDGADLETVAIACGMTVADVIALHAGATYTVAFCGFAPGFAYLRGLPAKLHLPRHPTPRTSVAAGSLAIASEFAAVYPRASPGGWNLLGTTSVTLFDRTAEWTDERGPALLTPGNQVRFIPVEALPPLAHAAGAVRRHAGGSAFTVISAGVASTIQDAGRSGGQALGVPPSGMVDPLLGGLMNRLVGNSPDVALIETCGGLAIRAHCALVVTSSETISPVFLAAGQTFGVRGGDGRRWHYLAVRGGVTTTEELGSSSTDTMSGLGPAPLAVGDSFGVGIDPSTPLADASPVPPVGSVVRISPGPRLDWFEDGTFDALSRSTLKVVQASRVGVRLAGPDLTRVRHDELPSEGLLRGAIQAPPSGELVMMLADHPTTGGYPVVAVVHPDDVHKVAQLPQVTCTPT